MVSCVQRSTWYATLHNPEPYCVICVVELFLTESPREWDTIKHSVFEPVNAQEYVGKSWDLVRWICSKRHEPCLENGLFVGLNTPMR